MAGFDKLMRRLGYAKLDTYGLVATADDRILATRPGGVLDDGYGGRVVGWRVEDLAAAELAPWQPITRVSAPVKVAPLPMLVAPAKPVAATPPPIPMLPKPAPLPAMTTAIATFKAPAPAVVAELDEEKSEDDWEWEIAVAKARAAAEEAELAARVIPIASARVGKPVSKPVGAPAPVIKPAPIAVAKPKFVAHDPITEVDPVRPVTKTVIPVPTLPSFKAGVRTTQPMAVVAAPPRRFPKGTMPEVAPEQMEEKTRTDLVAVAPVASVAKPTALPSVRQRQATRG